MRSCDVLLNFFVSVYIGECLELLLKLDEVLTLISKLHTDI